MPLKIEDLFRKTTLPKRYFSDNFIVTEKFDEETKTFLNALDKCDGSEFCDQKQAIIHNKIKLIKDNIILNIESIKKLFCFYEDFNFKDAQDEFDKLMLRMKNDLFISSIDDWVMVRIENRNIWTRFRITPGSRYFRVRPVEYESDNIQNNPDELFHIPLSKRAYVNNERFSLAGFPSLYLSTMLPLAWQECGYPQKYYFSEFQYKFRYDSNYEQRLINKELKFLSLYSPDDINYWGISVKYSDFDLWIEVIMRYLKTYPLILACSFVNQSGKVPFKQEYIIPQMLMQWVLRNKNIVQGISYFTCLDTSDFISHWCAYNIVIPALPPYDDNKYSQKLKKEFCWSYPQFYSLPLTDKKKNEKDRKILYDFIADIRNTSRTHSFPQKLYNYINDIINISGCFMCLLDNASDMNMQLALHTLTSLEKNCVQINKIRLKELIHETLLDKTDHFAKNNTDINEACNAFEYIYNRFISNNTNNGIIDLIYKYKETCWNNLHPHSEIMLLYLDVSEITEPIEWFQKNHILYSTRKLKADDETVKFLKEVATISQISLNSLFSLPVKSDDWIKENICTIKAPIIIKNNNVSIFSPTEIKSHEFLQTGFNIESLKEKLQLTSRE